MAKDYYRSDDVKNETKPVGDNVFESTYGLDADAFTYEMDAQSNFEMEDGECLEGEELISYLTKSNHALKDKVKSYYKKCSDLQEKIYEQQDTCYKTVESVRHFYRNMIFFGNSRGAIMVKMATNKI